MLQNLRPPRSPSHARDLREAVNHIGLTGGVPRRGERLLAHGAFAANHIALVPAAFLNTRPHTHRRVRTRVVDEVGHASPAHAVEALGVVAIEREELLLHVADRARAQVLLVGKLLERGRHRAFEVGERRVVGVEECCLAQQTRQHRRLVLRVRRAVREPEGGGVLGQELVILVLLVLLEARLLLLPRFARSLLGSLLLPTVAQTQCESCRSRVCTGMRRIAWALLGTHPPTGSDPREAHTVSVHRMCSSGATSGGTAPQVRVCVKVARARFLGAAHSEGSVVHAARNPAVRQLRLGALRAEEGPLGHGCRARSDGPDRDGIGNESRGT